MSKLYQLRPPPSQRGLGRELRRVHLVELATPADSLLELRCSRAWPVRIVLSIGYVLAPTLRAADRLVAIAALRLFALGPGMRAAAVTPIVPSQWRNVRVHPRALEDHRG